MKKYQKSTAIAFATALATTLVLVACSREVSSESQRTVNSDGSTKTKEKTVTESASGSVTKEEKSQTTPPTKP